MTKPKHFPPIEFLRECFAYDLDTGLFRWRTRPERHFPSASACNAWNARFAGTQAFAVVSAAGYPTTKLKFQGLAFRMFAARVAWAMATGGHPKSRVDHIDCDRANTKFSNLREAETWQNGGNRRPWIGKLKGAFWDAEHERYRAILTVRGKRFHLGRFDTAEEAHAVYLVAAKERFGEFARAA